MRLTRAAIALVPVLGLAVAPPSAFAQRAAPDHPGRPEDADPGEALQAEVDVDRLPLDLRRVHRGLRQPTVRVERDGLNLRYVIEVFGQAPPLVVFTKEDNLAYGPVPYGAPTHREMMEHITPKEYRAPAADISALIRWLAERARKQNEGGGP